MAGDMEAAQNGPANGHAATATEATLTAAQKRKARLKKSKAAKQAVRCAGLSLASFQATTVDTHAVLLHRQVRMHLCATDGMSLLCAETRRLSALLPPMLPHLR